MRTRMVVLAALTLAGCQPEPRSAEYFEAHPADAARTIAACDAGRHWGGGAAGAAGRHRGGACEPALAGPAAIAANKRLELFRRSFK